MTMRSRQFFGTHCKHASHKTIYPHQHAWCADGCTALCQGEGKGDSEAPGEGHAKAPEEGAWPELWYEQVEFQ